MKQFITMTKLLIAVALVAGMVYCTSNTTAPRISMVDITVNVAIYQTENIDSVDNIVYPSLIEDKVRIYELIEYPDDKGDITVPFKFSDTSRYAEILENNIGRRIAIAINGKVVSMPLVKSKITNGSCSVLLTPSQVPELLE